MEIGKDTVVSLTYELLDTDGKTIERADEPVNYLHGGYGGIFPLVEQTLTGKAAGDSCRVRLEPDDAFGEYDAQLVHLEPRSKFPDNVAVGMQFEGRGVESGTVLIYTVTDVAAEQVVVDGNHPLAGKALDFVCTVTSVREATDQERDHGHAHGAHGHDHHH